MAATGYPYDDEEDEDNGLLSPDFGEQPAGGALALNDNPALALTPDQDAETAREIALRRGDMPAPGDQPTAFVDQTEDGVARMEMPDGEMVTVDDAGLREGQRVPIEGPREAGPDDSDEEPPPYRSAGAPNPMMTGIDPTAPPAQPAPLAQPPGGQLTVEQLAAAATAPTNAGGDAVDRVIAANPIPGPPPPPPGPVNPSEEYSKLYREQEDIAKRAYAAEQARAAAAAGQAAARASQATEDAAIAEEFKVKQNAVLADYAGRTQRLQDKINDETQRLAAMKVTDPWKDESTGNKVLAGLAIALGALGQARMAVAGGGQGRNIGLDMVNDAIESRFRLQQAAIEKQKLNVNLAKDQYELGMTAKQQALVDNKIQEAASYEAAAKRGAQLLMKQGMTVEQAESDARIASLMSKANEIRTNLVKDVGDYNNRQASLKIDAMNADTHRMVALGRAKRAGGGGGGAGGGPPTVKQQKEMAELSSKIDGMVQKVITNTGYKESVVTNQKYNQMATSLAGAKDNAALAAAGAGQFVKMAQGGTGVISDSDMKLFWGKIGGIQDRAENYVENALSGKMGAAKQKIVADAVRDLAKGARAELEGIGNQIRTRLEGEAGDIPWVRGRIPVYLDTYVPGLMTGRQAASGGGTAGPSPAAKMPDRERARSVQAQQVISSPTASAQDKAEAQRYLDVLRSRYAM